MITAAVQWSQLQFGDHSCHSVITAAVPLSASLAMSAGIVCHSIVAKMVRRSLQRCRLSSQSPLWSWSCVQYCLQSYKPSARPLCCSALSSGRRSPSRSGAVAMAILAGMQPSRSIDVLQGQLCCWAVSRSTTNDGDDVGGTEFVGVYPFAIEVRMYYVFVVQVGLPTCLSFRDRCKCICDI